MAEDLSVARDDFRKLTPVAVAEDIPPPDRVWSATEWDLIRRGHKAADMDDRWHVFLDGRRLYLHRSWTGLGVYEAEFSQVPGGWQISSAVVEGDRQKYRRQPDAVERAQLEALIEGKLLGIYDGPSHQRLTRARAEAATQL